MALMVLVVAGVMLAAMARQSCREALLAGAAQEQLQARWGSRGLEAAILPQANDIFLTQQEGGGPISPRIDARFDLGGMTFQAVLSDEQAKREANTIYRGQGPQGLTAAIEALQQDAAKPLKIALAPTPPIASQPASSRPSPEQLEFTSFHQLFRFDHPRQLLAPGGKSGGIIGRLTCWTPGKVNLARADELVLKTHLAGVLTGEQVDKVLKYRRGHPSLTLEDMVKELELGGAKEIELRNLLTDHSVNYSLWVVAHALTRDYYRFYVYASREDGGRELLSYAW